MAILHRIFVSKHKRKRVYIGRKTSYKKFLGLKTFKNVVYTKLSLPYQPKTITQVVKKTVVKKPKLKPRKHINFSMLKFLAARVRRQEVIAAQADVENFRDIKAESPEEKAPKEKFQAFLSHTVWAKMTYEQRGAHIRKRKALAIQSKFRHSEPAKYTFSNKHLRPALARMRFTNRRVYLKRLIKFASVDSYSTVVPLSNEDTHDLSTKNIKSVLKASNKIRANGSVYKNLTYASLLPANATKLIF